MILENFKVYYISKDFLEMAREDEEDLSDILQHILFQRTLDPFSKSLLFDDCFREDYYKFDINSSLVYCSHRLLKKFNKPLTEQSTAFWEMREEPYNRLLKQNKNYKPVSRSKDFYLNPVAL